MAVFDDLIGKMIVSISRSSCTQYIRVGTNNGDHFFEADNDCCNAVWIEHINGIELLPATVIEVEDREWQSIEPGPEDDVLEAGSYVMKTDKGYIDIEVRNTHNGYYGGRLLELTTYPRKCEVIDQPKFDMLTESI